MDRGNSAAGDKGTPAGAFLHESQKHPAGRTSGSVRRPACGALHTRIGHETKNREDRSVPRRRPHACLGNRNERRKRKYPAGCSKILRACSEYLSDLTGVASRSQIERARSRVEGDGSPIRGQRNRHDGLTHIIRQKWVLYLGEQYGNIADSVFSIT